MNPASLKKADLVELAQLLGVKFASTSRKDQIETIIRDHLSSNRTDVNLDKRLSLFTLPTRGAAGNGADGSPRVLRTRRSSQSDDDDESTDAELSDEDEKPKLKVLKQRLDDGIAHVKETTSLYREKTQVAITSSFSALQHQVSTVTVTNFVLILVEYAYLIYTALPSTIFGTWHYGVFDALKSVKHDVLYFTGILIALPLLITFVVNFTKMNSIKRKKHVYLVDPILFGITRFYIAAVLFVTNYAALRPYAILAAAAGISSALIGVYASLLQTS